MMISSNGMPYLGVVYNKQTHARSSGDKHDTVGERQHAQTQQRRLHNNKQSADTTEGGNKAFRSNKTNFNCRTADRDFCNVEPTRRRWFVVLERGKTCIGTKHQLELAEDNTTKQVHVTKRLRHVRKTETKNANKDHHSELRH